MEDHFNFDSIENYYDDVDVSNGKSKYIWCNESYFKDSLIKMYNNDQKTNKDKMPFFKPFLENFLNNLDLKIRKDDKVRYVLKKDLINDFL